MSSALNNAFPFVSQKQLGYQPAEVNEFVAKLREQYLAPESTSLTALQIRGQEFSLARGGYQIDLVDAAIDRLEDKFAEREISRMLAQSRDSVLERSAQIRELLSSRVSRPSKSRFSRTGLFLRGYDPRQVDSFVDQVSHHLAGRADLELSKVRRAVFRSSRNGYHESKIDAFIDRVIELLQIERNL